MIRKLLAIGGVICIVALAGAAAPAAASTASRADPPPIRLCGTLLYGHQGTPRCNFSYNGHLFNGNGANATVQLTEVTATWTVPALSCNLGEDVVGAADSIWVGMFDADGSLVQTGVNNECTLHGQEDTAWWEVANALPEQPLSVPVRVGDQITAEVSASGNGAYTMSLTDTRAGTEIWDFGKAYTIPGETGYPYADGVVIEPSITIVPFLNGDEPVQVRPLADFGTVTFTNARYDDTTHTAYPQDVEVYEAQTPPEAIVATALLTWTVTWNRAGLWIRLK